MVVGGGGGGGGEAYLKLVSEYLVPSKLCCE